MEKYINNYDSYKIQTPLKYNISSAFIIGIYNEFKLKESSKDSSFYFKYNFFRGYCLPYAYKNKEEEIKNNPHVLIKIMKK